jgi:histidine triad (HIT) family protein
MKCIFCEIASKKSPAAIVYEDKDILAFKDIKPVAPVHILVIPKKHIKNMNSLTTQDNKIITKIISEIPNIAKKLRIKSGYRVVINTGKKAQEEISHLHFHLIGGKELGWPPC